MEEADKSLDHAIRAARNKRRTKCPSGHGISSDVWNGKADGKAQMFGHYVIASIYPTEHTLTEV